MRTFLFVSLFILGFTFTDASAQSLRRVGIIGHRGDSGSAPENTLVSIEQAFDKNASIVEMDIRSSANGTAWLMHDGTLDRTTNGTGSINGVSDAYLRSLDAGSWFNSTYANEPVPTLEEAFAFIKGKGVAYLDLKETGLGPQIDAALTATGFKPQELWLWVNTNASEAATLRNLIPDAKLIWGNAPGNWQSNPNYFDNLRSQGIYGFDLSFDALVSVGSAFVQTAQDEGFYVSTYTVNTVSGMTQAIEIGVDGMETDYPALLDSIMIGDITLYDLDDDSVFDSNDWLVFVGNLGEQYTSLTPDQTLELGDFDGDLAVGHSDFVMFRDAYEAIHGAGSFALVPEPVTLGLVLPSLLLVGRRVRGGRAQ